MEWRKGVEGDQENIQRNQVDRQLQKNQEDDQRVAEIKDLPREKHRLEENRREGLRKRRRKNRHLRTRLRTLKKMTRKNSNSILPSTTSHNQTNCPSALRPVNRRECHFSKGQ